MRLVAIGVVAEAFGVSSQTIRNWCEQGMFKVSRTIGGHRRFHLEEINEKSGESSESKNSTIIYSRVSSYDQLQDLKRQTEELKQYCQKQEMEDIEKSVYSEISNFF